jgi:hypothetical protein
MIGKPINEAYKSTRKYKCPFCDIRKPRMELIEHVEKEHNDMIPEEYTASRVVYDSINGKNYNTCMICKRKVYEWDEKHSRYKNLCDNPACRKQVRKTAVERHIKVYNRPTLLDDPDWQANHMLANRKISGTYTFEDGGTLGYTASYERKCLEFLDKVCHYKSSEIQSPGPVFYYEYKGKKHFYISDFYIIPANLVIEVKDGGSNPNTRSMPEYRGKQMAKEKMVTSLGQFNYLRLTNNQFDQILNVLADIKYDMVEERPVKIHINEVGGLAAGPVGSALPNATDQDVYLVPRMMNTVFDDAPVEFFAQVDGFEETYIGQGSDGKFYKYYHEDVGDQPFIFKYVGKNKNKKLHKLAECMKSGKSYNENYILSLFFGHKPMVIDEILCNEAFELVDNPFEVHNYEAIAESVYKNAFKNKEIENISKRMKELKL